MLIYAWQITMVTLAMIAMVGLFICSKLLNDAKQDRDFVEATAEQDFRALLALVDRNIRIARTRTYLSAYYVVIVPCFLLLSIHNNHLMVPLWLILIAAWLNYIMICYSVWATMQDQIVRKELLNGRSH